MLVYLIYRSLLYIYIYITILRFLFFRIYFIILSAYRHLCIMFVQRLAGISPPIGQSTGILFRFVLYENG